VAGAQNIDSATREVDRDIRKQVERETWEIPKKPQVIEEEPAEKKKKGKKFFVRKIKLTGVESIDPEVLKPVIEKYEHRENTVSDLKVLSRRISREYLKYGIIAACVVPPQEAKEGVFTLQVVESHMGELKIEDMPFFSKDIIRNYWTIEKGEVLNYNEMSRILQLLNKNPDLDVNATLHAGDDPETTDVLVRTKAHFPIHFTANFDNEGSPSTGKERKTFGFKHNNFLFVGDTLIYGYTYGTSFSGNYVYHRVPITNIGTSIMYGGSLFKAAPRKEYSVLGLSSRSVNGSIFAYQDLFVKDLYLGNIYTGFEAKDKTVKQISGTTTRDRLRIIRVGGDFIFDLFGGVTYMSPELSQGINGLGARRKHMTGVDDTPTSRDAENTFTKFNFQMTHTQPLPWLGMRTRLNFESQLASEKLSTQEEMFLGGIDSVRGYPSGDFLADDAFQSNVELHVPAFFLPSYMKLPFDDKPMSQRWTGLVFFDYAHGERRSVDAATNERKKVDFASFGAGMKIRLYDQVTFRLEWGIPTGPTGPITETGKSRFHFSVVIEEKLPEMINSIREDYQKGNTRLSI
jgi:hemolysin activation/secretion protein